MINMIRNHEVIRNKFECGKIVANYLIRHGVPLLHGDENKNKYYFVNSKNLKDALDNAPFWIKIIGAV
jgi:hypothetical protein